MGITGEDKWRLGSKASQDAIEDLQKTFVDAAPEPAAEPELPLKRSFADEWMKRR